MSDPIIRVCDHPNEREYGVCYDCMAIELTRLRTVNAELCERIEAMRIQPYGTDFFFIAWDELREAHDRAKGTQA